MKDIKDMTFDELVDEATRKIHSGLLAEGGKGMRSEVYTWLDRAIRWREWRGEASKKT